MRVSVVIPALNEAGNIAALVKETYEGRNDLIGLLDQGSDIAGLVRGGDATGNAHRVLFDPDRR